MDFRPLARDAAMTADEYWALDAAGKINRPLTWGPMRRRTDNEEGHREVSYLDGLRERHASATA